MGDARSVHIERWCRYFTDQGYEVALFSLEPKTISAPVRFYPAGRRTPFGFLNYYLARADFKAALDDFRPDLVNAHYVVSYGWLASYCRECPVIVTAWGSDLLLLPQKSMIHRKRIEKALDHAVFCTVDNHNLHLAAARFLPDEKIYKVIMGIDRGFYASAPHPQYTSSGVLKIIAPRGLEPVYDPRSIIEAAKMLRGQLEFHITLLGNEPRAAAIKSELASLGISDTVAVKPMMPHEAYIESLKDYHLYLSASLSDSTSVALLEAMTVGLFPVVSDIDGNREWIRDGHNGIMFRAGSPESLCEAVLKAAAGRDKFQAVAEINRERIGAEAIWQDNMDNLNRKFMELSGNE